MTTLGYFPLELSAGLGDPEIEGVANDQLLWSERVRVRIAYSGCTKYIVSALCTKRTSGNLASGYGVASSKISVAVPPLVYVVKEVVFIATPNRSVSVNVFVALLATR